MSDVLMLAGASSSSGRASTSYRKGRKRAPTRREILQELIDKRAGHRDALQSSTPERILQDGGEIILSEDKRAQLVHVSMIDRLLARHRITKRQYDGADKLRNDLATGQLDGTIHSVDWDRTRASERDAAAAIAGLSSDACLDARRRYRAAVDAVGARLFPMLEAAVLVAPPDLTMAAVGEQLFGRKGKGGEASALEVLKVALDLLADHYFGAETTRARGFWWRPGMGE